MRSRRNLLVLLVPVAVLSACGGGGDAADQRTAAPNTTTVSRAPQLTTTVASAAPAPAPAPTTRAPTTAAPTAPPPTTPAPTSTRQVVILPPGVTETDRIAAEAAAIGWWEEFYRQLDLLPDFKPDAFLRKAVAGRPAGPAMVSEFTKFQSKGFVVRKGNVRRVVILNTRFVTPATAEVEVCAADDGAFVNKSTGATESEGLVRTFFLNVLEKTDEGWTIADYGSSRASEDGKTCD